MEEEDDHPKRKKLYLSVVIIDLLYISSGCASAWSSPVIAILNLSAEMSALVGSSLAVGAVVGPWVNSLFMDRLGKRATISINYAIFIISYIVLISSIRTWSLVLGRFFCGVGLGLSFNVVPAYINDIADVKVRQACKTLVYFFVGIGQMIEYSVGGYGKNYSALQVATLTPSVVGILPLYLIPESPYWLMQKGRNNEALISLQWYRGLPTRQVLPEWSTMKSNMEVNALAQHKVTPWQALKNVISEDDQRRALGYCLLCLTIQAASGYFALVGYIQQLLKPNDVKLLTPDNIAIMFAGCTMATSLLSPVFVMRFGMKVTLVGCYLGMGLSMINLTTHVVTTRRPSDECGIDLIFHLCNLLVYASCFAIGAGHLPRSLMAEITPPWARGAVSGIGGSWNCFVIFIYLFAVPWIQKVSIENLWMIFASFSLVSMIGGLAVLIIIPETKGLTLIEVQNLMKK